MGCENIRARYLTHDHYYCSLLIQNERYITPERHVVESLLFTSVSILVFVFLQNDNNENGNTDKSGKRQQQQQKAPSKFMKLITLFMFTSQLYYKGRPKILEMLAPCNVLWCLAMVLHFYPNLSASKSQNILQLFVTWVILPTAAIVNPDTSNCTAFGEITLFYVQHFMLIIVPIYYVLTQRLSVISESDEFERNIPSIMSFNMRQWLMGCAFKITLYFPIVSFVNIWSGMNINYMMSPPPGDMVSGENFRLVTIVYLGILFMMDRCVFVALELLLVRKWNEKGQVISQKDA